LDIHITFGQLGVSARGRDVDISWYDAKRYTAALPGIALRLVDAADDPKQLRTPLSSASASARFSGSRRQRLWS
jgi:hypothetical protein